jgi:hypothetical protein
MTNAPRLPDDIRSERGKQTAGSGIVAMTGRQVGADDIPE